MIHHLRHWFTPHHSNNYRAKLLQNTGLALVLGLVIGTSAIIRLIESSPLHILGFTSSITIDEVVSATNKERLSAGLSPLRYSEVLADAARRKAANMLEENYWAHNSPSGKNPWTWFNAAGYRYTYAGENLAKDFGSTDRMMAAWMNSPTHKANIIGDKYQEIGIAIVPGTLTGSETVLVVQLFGAKGSTTGVVDAKETPTIAQVKGAKTESIALAASPKPMPNPTFSFGRIDQFLLKKIVGVATGTLFLLALILDLIIAENSRLSRRVGKNWGHIIVINVVLLLITIARAGSIQ